MCRSLREATTRRGSWPSARLRFSVTSSFDGSATATSGRPSSKPTGRAANMCAFSAESREVALGSSAKLESSTKRRPFWSASSRPRSRSSIRPLSSRTSPRRLPERTPSWSASSSCSSVSRPARKISVPSGTPRLATSAGVGTAARPGALRGRSRSAARPSTGAGPAAGSAAAARAPEAARRAAAARLGLLERERLPWGRAQRPEGLGRERLDLVEGLQWGQRQDRLGSRGMLLARLGERGRKPEIRTRTSLPFSLLAGSIHRGRQDSRYSEHRQPLARSHRPIEGDGYVRTRPRPASGPERPK